MQGSRAASAEMAVRRSFENSRVQFELWEAVYDALLSLDTAAAGGSEPEASVVCQAAVEVAAAV